MVPLESTTPTRSTSETNPPAASLREHPTCAPPHPRKRDPGSRWSATAVCTSFWVLRTVTHGSEVCNKSPEQRLSVSVGIPTLIHSTQGTQQVVSGPRSDDRTMQIDVASLPPRAASRAAIVVSGGVGNYASLRAFRESIMQHILEVSQAFEFHIVSTAGF